jgi:hypothetical protein
MGLFISTRHRGRVVEVRHVGLPSGPLPILARLDPAIRGCDATCLIWCCAFHGWRFVTRWFGVDGEMVEPYFCEYASHAAPPIVDVLDTDEKVAVWRNR